jgi:diguanylate cyclase (GGDEF)-like protein
MVCAAAARSDPMLQTLDATEMGFLQIATLQAVACGLWALGAGLVATERRALAHWAAYAGLASMAWFGLALHYRGPPLLTVLAGLGAALALRRGIRLFTGAAVGWRGAVLALAIVGAAGLLPDAGAWRAVRAVLNFGVLAAVYLGIALDLRHHARTALRWRWPVLLALPPLFGAAALAARAALALLRPGSVVTDMTQHSALNVGSALVYIVLVLLLHATLLVLVVSRLVGELQQLARRDPLTGLPNRRAMLELLDAQAARTRRASDTFAVLLIDLDRFKAINDGHGHEVGDRALAHAAQRIAQTLRPIDRLGRLGGDEFVALLPGRDAAGAAADAEGLRRAVQEEGLACGELRLALSLSIGVAQYAGEDVARLLARADAALLRAKRGGRNRVERADTTAPPPGARA